MTAVFFIRNRLSRLSAQMQRDSYIVALNLHRLAMFLSMVRCTVVKLTLMNVGVDENNSRDGIFIDDRLDNRSSGALWCNLCPTNEFET